MYPRAETKRWEASAACEDLSYIMRWRALLSTVCRVAAGHVPRRVRWRVRLTVPAVLQCVCQSSQAGNRIPSTTVLRRGTCKSGWVTRAVPSGMVNTSVEGWAPGKRVSLAPILHTCALLSSHLCNGMMLLRGPHQTQAP